MDRDFPWSAGVFTAVTRQVRGKGLRLGNRHIPVTKSAEPTVDGMSEAAKQKLVVVGAGMVTQRLVEALDARGATATWDIEVFGEETRPPYDRVALTSFFSDKDP
jgi:hypothetical protein